MRSTVACKTDDSAEKKYVEKKNKLHSYIVSLTSNTHTVTRVVKSGLHTVKTNK